MYGEGYDHRGEAVHTREGGGGGVVPRPPRPWGWVFLLQMGGGGLTCALRLTPSLTLPLAGGGR